jgi:type IV secretion system protein VirD4
MAEYRPYRIANQRTQMRLTQVKLVALSGFFLTALLINWRVTQYAAWMFGHARALGPARFGLYAPWEWIVWWLRWHWVEQFQPMWEVCIRKAALPLLGAAAVTAGTVLLARYLLSGSGSDLHGSARWATTRDVRAAGLIPPRAWLPGRVARLAVRARLVKPRLRRVGIYLGIWRGEWRTSYLRDCGPGHVLVMAPTRSGKGVGIVIPTLLVWPHSALIHDLKGENWQLTAGARRRLGHVCLKFDPTDTSGASVKYNPLEQVRLHTVHEAADVQNIVHMIVDPDGKGLNDHWVKTGAALLTGAILHLLYGEPNKTLRGLAGFLSDPRCTLMETIERMLKTEHDPDGSMVWRDYRGVPTRTHPLVAESMRELLSKSDNERAGVFSTVMSFLSLYRDPIVAANTEYSEFKISDLVNHERPVSLYLVVPMASRDRLRPLIRLMLNQIVRTLTTTLAYRNGRAVSANRHPLLLMLDEFPMLGRLDVLADALSLIAGYGIRACLVAQDLTQIHAAYGRDEAITINCDTIVAFAPNKMQTAQELSRFVGEATVRHAHRTVSTGGTSLSEPEVARPLITPDEVRRLNAGEVLILPRGHHAIRAARLPYHTEEFFRRRAAIAPPTISDRILTARPSDDGREKDKNFDGRVAIASEVLVGSSEISTKPNAVRFDDQVKNENGAGGDRAGDLQFLKYATEEAADWESQ